MGLSTPTRIIDANLDRTFVKNSLVFVVLNIWDPGLPLPPLYDPLCTISFSRACHEDYV